MIKSFFAPRKSAGDIVLLLLISLLLMSQTARSQDLKFDRLSVEQGLSQGNTGAVHQDKYGFIWISTEDGLNMFDGYTFTVFRNNPSDSLSISNNDIRCLAEDLNGNMWIGTQNGLNLYDRASNTFIRYSTNGTGGKAISSNEINCIFFDFAHTLWLGTAKGINVYDSATHTFQYYQHQPNVSNSVAGNIVRNIKQDSFRRYWIGTSEGLSMLSTDRKTFTNFFHDPANPESISSNKIITLFLDATQNLWIGTFDAGLNKMNVQKHTITHYMHNPADPNSLGNQYVYGIAENKSGELWLATDGALSLMDRGNGTFINYRNVPGNEHSLASNIVTSVTFDHNDRMLVSTRFGGVNVYDKDKYGFTHYSNQSYNKNSISNNTVTNFDEDAAGNLYVGTDGGGLNYINRRTGTIQTVADDKLSILKVLAVEVDRKGQVWAGTWSGGLNRFDPRTNQIKYYKSDPANPRSLSDNNIFDVLEDHNGIIWVATYGNGLNKYNAETDDFTQYTHNPDNPSSISASAIDFIYEDSSGKIWIATEQDGLNELDPATEVFTHYRSDGSPGCITSNSLYSIYEDSKKRMWIGTDGGGLNLFDREAKTFKAYRQHDGLPNDAVVGILEDKAGNIWLSTNKGICRFNPEKLTFKSFTTSDGLQGNQFNRWAAFRTSTGDLMFGGTNGFNMFDPAKVKDNPYVPPVYITDFKLFNKPVAIGENEVLKTNILFTKDIELNYGQNIFSFEFTALNFRQPEKNQYKYIMEGFQDEWIDAGTERKVSYTNLSPGEYVFRVIASNNDGVWNKEGTAIRITIVPPFWRTWWFLSLVVIAAVSAIIGYNRRVKRKAKQQQLDLHRVIEEQTREVKQQNEEIIKKSEKEKVQSWITQGLAKTSEIISKHKGNLESLSQEILKNLVHYVEAQQGVMAVAIKDDPDDVHLKILATYGTSKERIQDLRIEVGAGLIGATYQDKEKKTLDNIPENYTRIESGLGDAQPARLVLLPLTTEDGDILGVVELAFLSTINDEVQEFLDKVSSIIALNIHAANLSYKTTVLLQQSKEQTEEMQAQEEEMRQNMEELEATQEEFRRRELEFQRRIQELERELKMKNA